MIPQLEDSGFSPIGMAIAEFQRANLDGKSFIFQTKCLKFLKIRFNKSILFLTIMSILLKIRQKSKAFRLIDRRSGLQDCTYIGNGDNSAHDRNPGKHPAVKDTPCYSGRGPICSASI
jgi:hypothetical protein